MVTEAAEHLKLVAIEHEQSVIKIQHQSLGDLAKSLFHVDSRITEEFPFEHDHIRRMLICEPRGSVARHVNLITPPIRPECDAGVIIMEPTEYPPMSGSNSMCAATVLLEAGLVEKFGLNGCPIYFDLVGKDRYHDGSRTVPVSHEPEHPEVFVPKWKKREEATGDDDAPPALSDD